MLDITFLTTNSVKLSHIRYLSRNWDVNINQHRLFHYGVGYEEPRLFERNSLLEESVKDAIIRWKKNISKLENRFYFLEDTSVVIHALSEDGKEVPGVDIKYWMRENTFEKIDSLLKLKGNNRNVTVYSHIVLVLTKDLKEKFNKEYIIFKSKTNGKIINEEISFETNILYPWLDNSTFNKWFVPDNESLPISMLPINRADEYDFRKTALEKMLRFLEKNNKFPRGKSRDIDLTLLFKPIFIICGPTCAGKTTIGKYLSENYDYYHIEASDFMTLEFLKTHGHKSKFDIGDFAKAKLREKPYIVVDNIINHLEYLVNINSIVVTGFRTPQEVEYFQMKSPYQGEFITVYIDADSDIRFNRWKERNRELNNTSKSKFKKINQLQCEMGVDDIKKVKDVSFVDNCSSLEDYYKVFSKDFFLNRMLKEVINTKIEDLSPKLLEDAIVLALAIDYRDNNQTYLTTTEISRKINSSFKKLEKDKHKDNVSRYFNQKTYIYYEVKVIDEKLKYRLSPTGYSYVLTLLKDKYSVN
jgi:dephospho-CoA kinase/inosine/xanthosine triphosphate pyrophosphatase family protein